jgi:hypothetical protein
MIKFDVKSEILVELRRPKVALETVLGTKQYSPWKKNWLIEPESHRESWLRC